MGSSLGDSSFSGCSCKPWIRPHRRTLLLAAAVAALWPLIRQRLPRLPAPYTQQMDLLFGMCMACILFILGNLLMLILLAIFS